MIKSLLNKIATWLVQKTSTQNTVNFVQSKSMEEMLKAVEADKKVTVSESVVKGDDYYNSLSWKDLSTYNKDVIDNWTTDIQAEIMAKGYKEIPSILSQYRTEMIQHFVMLQKIALGDYAPEFDNLDSLTREQLISTVSELNQLSYEKRMIDSGKANTTEKQIEVLKKYGVKDIPTNRFDASRKIDEIMKSKGINTNRPYDPNPSLAQMKKFTELCAILARPVDEFDISTKAKISAVIAGLTKEIQEQGLTPKATPKQIETVGRYLKLLNKRMTEKRKTEFASMTTVEISAVIAELAAEYNNQHPELSEGQKQYIISLCTTLNIPYSIADISRLTKQEATAKIEQLNIDYAYLLTRKTNPGMTKDMIRALSQEQLKALIQANQTENKNRDYKNFPNR